MVKFLFSVYTITEAKQSNRQGGARAGMVDALAPPLVAFINELGDHVHRVVMQYVSSLNSSGHPINYFLIAFASSAHVKSVPMR